MSAQHPGLFGMGGEPLRRETGCLPYPGRSHCDRWDVSPIGVSRTNREEMKALRQKLAEATSSAKRDGANP